MRRSGKPGPSFRVSVHRGRLLCIVPLRRRDRSNLGVVSELALVASLASPYLRWLTVFKGQCTPILDDTPQAA
ncbi:MAG TPA: hypothetical protein VNL16_07320 [Chloroflexota bacterium]|nr:hypothetical protein [Chloroflexota bacterium]